MFHDGYFLCGCPAMNKRNFHIKIIAFNGIVPFCFQTTLFTYIISPGRNPWNRDRMDTKIRIAIPATNPPMVHPRMVSVTEILKNLLIAQNPESLGRDRPIPPAQIAIAHRIGDTPLVAMVLDIIAAVVIRATVVEP